MKSKLPVQLRRYTLSKSTHSWPDLAKAIDNYLANYADNTSSATKRLLQCPTDFKEMFAQYKEFLDSISVGIKGYVAAENAGQANLPQAKTIKANVEKAIALLGNTHDMLCTLAVSHGCKDYVV